MTICPHCEKEIISPQFSRSKNRIIEEIKQAVCKEFDMDVSQIYIRVRTRHTVLLRQVIGYYLTKHRLGSLAEIATCFGNALSNHTSIIHGNKTVEDLIFTDPDVRHSIEYLDKIVEAIVKSKTLRNV